MFLTHKYLLVGAILAHLGTAGAQDRPSDSALSYSLGPKLFDSVCMESIGNPTEFHRRIEKTELTKQSSEQSPNNETWVGSVGEVGVSVQYTNQMTCFVYMSHAEEKDVRLHIITAIKKLTRQGVEVRMPPAATSQPADGSSLKFSVLSPQGNYALMALFRPGAPSLARSALVVGPFR